MSSEKNERLDRLDHNHIYSRYLVLKGEPYNLTKNLIAKRLNVGRGSLDYIIKLRGCKGNKPTI